MVTINTNDINLTEKDSRVNINMRIKESLKNKIKDTMTSEGKSPDEFFSEMFYSYLKEQAKSKNEADYSTDIQELQMVIGRTVTIFQNMIEKTYMQNSIVKDNFVTEIESLKSSITSEYEAKIKNLEKECSKVKMEYDLIAEQAEALLKDTKELKETSMLLKNANSKNEELIATYKEQIKILKLNNSILENKNSTLVDASLLEKAEIQKEKDLLKKDKEYQEIINNMQEKYNTLQTKHTSLLESINTKLYS